MIVMAACIFLKLPAIPSVLGGIISGFLIALSVQGTQLGRLLSVAFSGYVSQTGHELADTLLSTGGLESMMYTISIITVSYTHLDVYKRQTLSSLKTTETTPCAK